MTAPENSEPDPVTTHNNKKGLEPDPFTAHNNKKALEMSNEMKKLVSGLQNLDKDIIEGVENNLVEKIPGWKKAMVSYYY